MSRALEIYKRQLQRLAGNRMGDNVEFARVWLTGKQAESAIGEIFAAPITTENVVDLNDAAGDLIFVPGVSDPGGDDVLV